MSDVESELLVIVPDETSPVGLNTAGRVVNVRRAHELDIEGCWLRVGGSTVLFLERVPASLPVELPFVAARKRTEHVELIARAELTEVTVAALGIIGLQNFGHLDGTEHVVVVGGWRARVRHRLQRVAYLPSDEPGHAPSESHWRVLVRGL